VLELKIEETINAPDFIIKEGKGDGMMKIPMDLWW
jgi:hypothetical protein